jgi:hypothetical protein
VQIARRRWWAAGLVGGWAVALLVAAIWSAHQGPATVRPQSGLAEGWQALDRAVAEVVEAAGPGVTVDLQPYERRPGCRVTLARRGTELDRTVLLTVPAGQEAALLDRLVTRLPAEWDARYHAGRNRFFADAGDFVAIRGGVADRPGQVTLTAATGCRPGADPGERAG